MPAFKQNTVLVYFAGYDNHVGFYPTPSALDAFKKEIAVYKNSKGAVQFPLNEAFAPGVDNKDGKIQGCSNPGKKG
jgi:uncharacterized protein YdhG (YjbR/CyaY superfamily)